MTTTYRPPMGVQLTQRTFGTTVGLRQRSIVLNRLAVTATGAGATAGWLGVAVSPIKPSGFVRHDRAGRYLADSQLSFLRYLPADRRLETNTGSGPVFDTAPASYGLYGNPNGSWNPDQYLSTNPFADLAASRALNGADTSHDSTAGLCTAAFLWPFDLSAGGQFTLDLRLPVDDFRDSSDFAELAAPPASDPEAANLAFWQGKLNGSGLQASLPPVVTHLFDLYRSCRADPVDPGRQRCHSPRANHLRLVLDSRLLRGGHRLRAGRRLRIGGDPVRPILPNRIQYRLRHNRSCQRARLLRWRP
ncbi:MAG: hypothetical protein ACRDR6_12980 [Pseudonocardiaceae bacterium]